MFLVEVLDDREGLIDLGSIVDQDGDVCLGIELFVFSPIVVAAFPAQIDWYMLERQAFQTNRDAHPKGGRARMPAIKLHGWR
jgi:hypothetical protein